MARLKTFVANVQITDQFLRLASVDVEQYVTQTLDELLPDVLRGPRGGRYVAVRGITYLGKERDADGLVRNIWTFRAERLARYVRPGR